MDWMEMMLNVWKENCVAKKERKNAEETDGVDGHTIRKVHSFWQENDVIYKSPKAVNFLLLSSSPLALQLLYIYQSCIA